MDKIDLAILTQLERDGRQSYSQLAEIVALSKTPCWLRVQALEKNGTIKGYRAVVDPAALDLHLTAFVGVSVEFGLHREFEEAVRAHPAIIDGYTTAGGSDYLLHVMTKDVTRLDELLREDLCGLPGVQRFSTTVCMKQIKGAGHLMDAARAANPGAPGFAATAPRKRG